jgi:uncharacterized protein (UPF0332 family)
MNISENNIKEYINKYCNDVFDYGEDGEYENVEKVLKPLNELIVDSTKTFTESLKEKIQNSNDSDKEILKDFLLYIKETQ